MARLAERAITPAIILCSAVVAGIIAAYMIGQGFNTGTAVITVCKKDSASKELSTSVYPVWALHTTQSSALGDEEIYLVDTIVINPHRENAETERLYNSLQPNTTYEVSYKGFEFGLLNGYRNILTATPTAVQHPEYCQGKS